MIGGNGGSPYVRTDPDNHPVIGFAVQLGSWGHPTLGHVYPLYSRDTSMFPADAKISLAQTGYAVGGIYVNKLDGADAIKIIFMHIKGNALDPHDFYTTNWLGDTHGGTPTKLGATGQPVLGTFGRQGMNNDTLGLILDATPPTTQP